MLRYEVLDCLTRNQIIERVSKMPQKDEEKILWYLNNGNETEDSLFGVIEDYITGDDVHTFMNEYTDNVWCWNSELAYHVGKYHYRISDEFRAHMEANNWQVPEKYRKKDEEPQKLSPEKRKKINDMWNF